MRRQLVASDGEDQPAEPGPLGEESGGDGHHEHDHDRQRHDIEQASAAKAQKRCIEYTVRRPSVRQDETGCDGAPGRGNELQPGQQEVHRERGEQVRHVETDDQERVEETDGEAKGKNEEHRLRRGEVPDDHGVARRHDTRRGHRANGEIEAAHGNRDRDPDADDRHHRHGL